MKEVKIYYTDKESIPVSYNRKVMLEKFKKYGEKSLGGFSVDDALENAFEYGIEFGASCMYDYLNDDEDEEEE